MLAENRKRKKHSSGLEVAPPGLMCLKPFSSPSLIQGLFCPRDQNNFPQIPRAQLLSGGLSHSVQRMLLRAEAPARPWTDRQMDRGAQNSSKESPLCCGPSRAAQNAGLPGRERTGLWAWGRLTSASFISPALQLRGWMGLVSAEFPQAGQGCNSRE